MLKTTKTPSWRTVMRRSKAAKTPKEAKRLRDLALELRRDERHTATAAKAVSGVIGRTGTRSVTLKAAGVAKAAVPMSGDGEQPMSREARHLPPNTLMGADSTVNAEPITPFAAAMTAIAKLVGKDNLEAFHDILRDFAIYHRNDMERDHVDTLRKVHEANAANVVRSYMALIDGLGHANGGPVPPYVVIPGLMAVRVYDALRLAGHSPD